MQQIDYIKEIAKYGLENDQEKLLFTLNELIEHSKQTKKVNFALQLQSILKDAIRQQQTNGIVKIGSPKHILREEDREVSDFILEKLTSDYRFPNLVCSEAVHAELAYFIEEHRSIELLRQYDLPVSNKVLFYGPSGCGKTLAAYVLAGELEKMMIVINLGAIVSSKLGETSKNLAKIFRRAATEDCIVFMDEFDTLGKIRDYSQDHGEMKRVVNTILQLFDYLPQSSIVIAATNQKDMIDDALLRRFDLSVKLELPDEAHINELINKTLASSTFTFDNETKAQKVIKDSLGLSYYTIQKTLLTAIKRSLFSKYDGQHKSQKIQTAVWADLINQERRTLLEAS
ncbi:AAA family ATPase [Spirosoma foliorum]|uniref:AAA family ATPase n=1 Tax=Spirosoma foliorum TaxID=2710596 RepID=A0A7G5GWH4_9BACT|nr:ATP-binding protein [Spirosoma foliorum]QMW03216.1 AAA family ATPase [Spirosoma foliorum]